MLISDMHTTANLKQKLDELVKKAVAFKLEGRGANTQVGNHAMLAASSLLCYRLRWMVSKMIIFCRKGHGWPDTSRSVYAAVNLLR